MNLFQLGNFTLHSGQKSRWKIEADALTWEDWEALAVMAVELLPDRFELVHGIPDGGLLFAKFLRTHQTSGGALLIVDDVWTTGDSMRKTRKIFTYPTGVIGCVAFARGPVDDWVTPLFQMPAQRT